MAIVLTGTNFATVGKIENDGAVYNSSKALIGKINPDGSVYNADNAFIGKIEPDGRVLNEQSVQIGKIERDGRVFNANSEQTGKVVRDGRALNAKGEEFCSARGFIKVPLVAAFCFFFFADEVNPEHQAKLKEERQVPKPPRSVAMPKTFKHPDIEQPVWELALKEVPNAKKEPFTPEKMHFIQEEWEVANDPDGHRVRRLKVVFLRQNDDDWLMRYYRVDNPYIDFTGRWSDEFTLYDLDNETEKVHDYSQFMFWLKAAEEQERNLQAQKEAAEQAEAERIREANTPKPPKEVVMPKTYEHPELEKTVWELGLKACPNAKKTPFTPEKMHFIFEDWKLEKSSQYPFKVVSRYTEVVFLWQTDGKWLMRYYMLYNQYLEASGRWSVEFTLKDLEFATEHVTNYIP